MISEKRLHNSIKKMKKQLADLNFFQMRNPISMHWWEKKKYTKINNHWQELTLNIIVETVALDQRYRDGRWAILETVLELVDKGLNAPTCSP